MEQEKVIEDLKGYIHENILSKDVDLTSSTHLQNAGMDSFSTVEILLFIERKYGLSIPDDKLLPENFQTLDAISKIVLELMDK